MSEPETPDALYRLNERGKPVKSVEHTLSALTSIVGGLARRRRRHDAGMNDHLGESELSQLVDLRAEVDRQIAAAVVDLYRDDRSWTDIAQALGVTRQAALKRYGPLVTDDAAIAAAQGRIHRAVVTLLAEGAERG